MAAYMKFYLMILLFLIRIMSCSAQNYIVVSKKQMSLYVINDKKDTIYTVPCGVGLNNGNKKKTGDNKTPEGVFVISKIQNSRQWTHDFEDGLGERKGAYGPWFIRLKVPGYIGIGIHGTCFPKTVGSRCSEGCIRLRNEDLVKIVELVKIGNKVIIESD